MHSEIQSELGGHGDWVHPEHKETPTRRLTQLKGCRASASTSVTSLFGVIFKSVLDSAKQEILLSIGKG